MVKITLYKSRDGCFKKIKALGHAGFSNTEGDIVCSAITMLLRTTLDVLNKKIELDIEAGERGLLSFSVRDFQSVDTTYLIFVCDFLETGFLRLQADYKKNISFNVKVIE
ncbi:MAG: ribosomal-processing cysteine protease Prp [Treponemataceae bacterium]